MKPLPRKLSATEPVARTGNLARASRGFARDRPIGYTIAPQPARQIWELHRIREESRQQSLISPHFRAFLEWAKCFVLGEDPFGLRFPLMPRADRDRLRDATLAVRDDWREFQEMPIGSRDETVVELAGQTLDWMLVDGDCFVIPYMVGGEWRYQAYPGDALAETSHTPITAGPGNMPQRALGITVDSRGRPTIYHFGQRARYRSLGYTSYSSDLDAIEVPAAGVWHIRDRRSSGGTVRGWPRIIASYEYMARLNEFDQAFIRATIRRVSATIALQRDPTMTMGDYDRDVEGGEAQGGAGFRIDGTGDFNDEAVKPYQESEAAAGNILLLQPGYTPVDIGTGVPTSQEADIVKQLEKRICAGLGVSVMSLTGDYSSTSFSGGQLGLMRDRATCADLQGTNRKQLIGPIYRRRFDGIWPDLMMRFPVLRAGDYRIFAGARVTMPRMPVLEKSKILAAAQKAFEGGLVGYGEARAEAGYSTDDMDSVIDEWKEARDQLGLVPQAPIDDDDQDDGAGEEKDDDDDEDSANRADKA